MMRWEQVQAYLWDIAGRVGIDIDDVRMRADYLLVEDTPTALQRLDPRYDSTGGSYVTVESISQRRLITAWRLQPFPGNPYYCVSSDVHVGEQFRRQGVNNRSNVFRQAQAKAFNFDVLLATVNESNGPELATLLRQNWESIMTTRQRNDNVTRLFRKVL
jgi:hypothetical protein